MKYKLVIFDWQGTLIDVMGQFVFQFITVSERLGLPKVNPDEVMSSVHLDLCTLIQTLFPAVESHKKQVFIEQFNHYRMHHCHDVCLFEGVNSLLSRLHKKNVFVGIATAASLAMLKEELAFSGLSPFIDVIKTPDHTLCKPAPDMLNEIMAEVGAEKVDTLMIGDSRCDFEAAQNAGIDFIGIHLREQSLITEVLEASGSVVDSIASLNDVLFL